MTYRRQRPASCIVWAAASEEGKCPLFFMPPKTTVTALNYKEMILEEVLAPWATAKFGSTTWCYQQDSAPAHSAKLTQKWLAENVLQFLSKEDWPSSSPDLNPFDYSLFSILQEKVNRIPYKSVEALKHAIIEAWAEIPEETIRATCGAFRVRLKAIVKAKGGHIECSFDGVFLKCH